MARGRMLSKSVSTDKALNALSLEAHFLYLMTVPHLDRDGLILADAPVLAATVIPRRPQIATRTDELVDEWINAGLVMAYEGNDGRILYFRGFRKNNPEMRYDREGVSQLPPPPGMIRTPTGLVLDESLQDSGTAQDEVRSNSGVTPEEVPFKLREVKLREDEEENSTNDPIWWQVWKDCFPRSWTHNPLDKKNLGQIAEEYGEDVLLRLIEHANRHKNRPTISVAYIDSILDGWKQDGKLNGNGPKKTSKLERVNLGGIIWERQNGVMVRLIETTQ